ncbi:DegT/DnrJ/EryC1/StrS family aminotransferase [Marisediminicola sp. UYEF4]|uniref:DegT/DnrJ/EryC1/StrS family aminotransferase n=1 Tax=Marisediminicola sp. UYEF4 TaxID=1756384 RepID=UPI0033926D59
MSVPLVDLGVQHRQIADVVSAGISAVMVHQGFILGPEVEQFERDFADYCGVQHALGVGNGTDALELALRAAGIGRGDEVIVPANTYVATAEAVMRAGAEIVLVDNDDNYLIDPDSVAEHLTSKTRAIMAVHLYGQTAPVEVLRQIVGPGVIIVEDAAQSQGALRQGARAGSLGHIAGTSFYPGKNLGAYGDAGAVMTNDSEYAHHIAQLRNHGGIRRYEHVEIGVNSRMDSIQAVVLSAKLALLDGWNSERRAAAALYDELLAGTPQIVTPTTAEGNEHVFHLYVVRAPERDRVVAGLVSRGVGASVHYPAPIHRLPAFRHLAGIDGSLPRAEEYSDQILSLPMFPGITPEQQEYVADSVRSVVGESA